MCPLFACPVIVLMVDGHANELLENIASSEQVVLDIVAQVVIAKSILDNSSKHCFVSLSYACSFLVELVSFAGVTSIKPVSTRKCVKFRSEISDELDFPSSSAEHKALT